MQEITRVEFDALKKQVDGVQEMTGKIYFAIVGNELTEDGGMVKQLVDVRVEMKLLDIEVKTIKATLARWKGIAVGLMISGGIIGALLQTLLHSK